MCEDDPHNRSSVHLEINRGLIEVTDIFKRLLQLWAYFSHLPSDLQITFRVGLSPFAAQTRI